MVGMADGFAQASGSTTVVNLHTAPGVGNAMGAIFNAQANHSPLLVTAGQQARAQITLQANLTNRDATRMPHPLVKWSYEPPRAEDVPLALAHGAHLAGLPPRGPVFVSLPMDDWDAEVDEADARARDRPRGQRPRRRRPGAGRGRWPSASTSAPNPVLVAGPDIDASGGWDTAVALAERQRLPVWASPGDRRRPPRLPREPPELPRRPAAGDRPGRPDARGPRPDPRRSAARSSPTTRTSPARCCPRAPLWSRSPATPTRRCGRRWATRSSPTSGSPSRRCSRRCPSPSRPAPEPNPGPQEIPPTDPLNASTVHTALGEVLPEDAIVVLESPSSTLALRNQLRLSRPGSYYFSAGGGLGFGLAASVGVQLAEPDRPVVCVIGEGSAQYAITAFWSAVAYDVPVTFLVLRNEEYAILKWFAEVEQVDRRPRPRPAEARRRRGRRGLRGQPEGRRRPRRGPRGARRCARLLEARAGRSPRRARDVALLGPMALLERNAAALAPQGGEPAADRAPDSLAAGTPQPLRGELEALLGRRPRPRPGQRPGPLRLRRQPLPPLPAGRGDGARRRRRRQGPRLRARAAASRSPSAPAAPASTARGRATASWSTSAATSAASRSRATARGHGSSRAPSSATPTASSPRTAASSAPTRPAPTSPRSAAWSPTTRAACAAARPRTPTRPCAR